MKTRSRSGIQTRPTGTKGELATSSQGMPQEAPYLRGDEIPIPEAIESDGESIWETWEQALADVARPFADTIPIRGYDESGDDF